MGHLPRYPGDPPPVASRTRAQEVDLPPDRSPRPATDRSRGPCAHPPAGPGEPALGLRADRGRAPHARHPGGCDDDPDPAPDRTSGSCPKTDRPDLDLSSSGLKARDHRLRLLYRRDGLAAHPLRPRVHRARQPADLSQPVNGSPGLGGGSPEQARNLAPDLDARASPVRFVIRDRDTKFCRGFDEVVRSEGARVIRTPIRAPNANAHPRARDRDDAGRVPRPDAHPEVGGISIEPSGPTPSTTTAGTLIAPSASPHRWPKPGFRSRSRSTRAMFADWTCSVDSSTSPPS